MNGVECYFFPCTVARVPKVAFPSRMVLSDIIQGDRRRQLPFECYFITVAIQNEFEPKQASHETEKPPVGKVISYEYGSWLQIGLL